MVAETIKLAHSIHPWIAKMPEYGEEPAPDENRNKIFKYSKDCKGFRWAMRWKSKLAITLA